MSYIGTNKIGKMYLGGTEITKAYLGNNIVYQNKPYDAEVEYLESTGAQYINLNYTRTSGNSYMMVVDCTPSNYANNPLFSINQDYIGFFIRAITDGDTTKVGFNTANSFASSGRVLLTYSVASNNKEFTVSDGVNSASYTSSNSRYNGPTVLFAAYSGSKGRLKLYSSKLYKNTVLEFDLIPVRVGSVGYMYDRVSGQLFGNSGTGDFILGPDKT